MRYDDFRRKYDHLFTAVLNNVTINEIYERILQSGLHYPIYDILFFDKQFKYEKDNPTDEMKTSTAFFQEHWDDVRECRKLLKDDLSRMVYGQAIRFRCTHDRKCFPPYSINNQYFPHDIIHLNTGEVFLDCGACKGDTFRRLQRESKNTFNKAVLFEVDNENIHFIRKSINDPRLLLVPKGVWSANTKVFFEDMGTDGSGRCVQNIDEINGKTMNVEVCTIDSLDCCKDATYIKMDIEGSEWEALHGAQETIKRNYPKLAICLYHNDEDYIRIISFVHELNPNYNLYVRHHSTNTSETVLYAIND